MRLDVIAVIVAAVVTALVCGMFVARMRYEPATPRTVVALGLATGLCALIAVVAVPVIFSAAGQGDPLEAPANLLTATIETLVRPLTIIVVVLAADAGFVVGWLQMRRSQGGEQ